MTRQLVHRHNVATRPDNACAWISVAILTVFLFSPIFGNGFILDFVSSSLLLNGCFGIAMLWISMADAPYSLKQVHWVFYVTFFASTPLMQYVEGAWPWGYTPTQQQVFEVSILVLIWGVLFAVVSGRTDFVSQKRDRENAGWLGAEIGFALTPIGRAILTAGSVLCLLTLALLVGFDNLFLRTTSGVSLESSSLSMLATVCLRAFVFGSFALLALNARKEKRHYVEVAIAGVCLLMACFPTAIARFNVAAIYLGIAVLFVPAFSRKRGLFALLLIMGFLVAYPLFNAFKYIGEAASGDVLDTIFRSMTAGYTSGNYDAFSIMFWCSDYISRFGITYGGQLLGACLFFIPRSLWPSKPVPSGELVFSSLNYYFTDLSFALPFEGFINFGFVGLPLFAIVYGVIVRKVDDRYWRGRMRHSGDFPTVLLLYYPFLLCLTFYMLRGAMMTTFTYVFGDLAVMTLLYLISRSLARREIARKKDEKGSMGFGDRGVVGSRSITRCGRHFQS